MNAKSIETQVESNNREIRLIQQQLSQIGANQALSQQLNNRLEMIKRAQGYWSNEYFKLTGKQLGLVSPTPAATPVSPTTPPNNANNENQNLMAEWQKIRASIRQSLNGNPNQARVEVYRSMLEKTYGENAPKIPGAVIFGNAKIGKSGTLRDYNAEIVRSNSSIYFESSVGVIIFSNGSLVIPTPNTLIEIQSLPGNKGLFKGKMEMNSREI